MYLMSGGLRSGPYVIASVSSGKYTLCLENGQMVRNGEEIDNNYLEAV